MANRILEVKNMKLYFPLHKNLLGKPQAYLRAVDDISFNLNVGETIGVVGESGCGKTTLGRTILRLYNPTGGKAIYFGRDVEEFSPNYYIKAIKRLPLYKLLIGKKLANSENESETINNIINESAEITGALILADNLTEIKSILLNKIKLHKKINKLEPKIIDLSYKKNKEEKIKILKEKLENYKKEYENVLNKIKDIKENIKQNNPKQYEELEAKMDRGINLGKLKSSEMRKLRVDIQLIFQDPYSSLPPRMTVGSIISEAVKVHHIVPKAEVYDYVLHIMEQCGLQPQYYDRYPHEFSGGQRQRICIARALAVKPKLIVCDEPVSALDVSIQAQIINLLKNLQQTLGLTYIFISHDLSVVKYITNKILVMYLGNIMEYADTEELFKHPLHPYTEALFSAVPNPDPDAKMNRIILNGDIPSPANPPKGCKFNTRCPKAMKICEFLQPKSLTPNPNHYVCCHLYDNEVLDNREQLEKDCIAEAELELEIAEQKEQAKLINRLKKKFAKKDKAESEEIKDSNEE